MVYDPAVMLSQQMEGRVLNLVDRVVKGERVEDFRVEWPFEREVPWRDGNRTRSAHRDELLRVLVEAVMPPEATVVRWELRAIHRAAEETGRSQCAGACGARTRLTRRRLDAGTSTLRPALSTCD
jgi:hypothetical protein